MPISKASPFSPAVYEAFGRTMLALRECNGLSGAPSLDWWAGQGGRTVEIEWQGGPWPAEVAELLFEQTALPEEESCAWSLKGHLEAGRSSDNPHYAYLLVLGVPVALRALEPIGRQLVLAEIAILGS